MATLLTKTPSSAPDSGKAEVSVAFFNPQSRALSPQYDFSDEQAEHATGEVHAPNTSPNYCLFYSPMNMAELYFNTSLLWAT
jgi:hypothetical protein